MNGVRFVLCDPNKKVADAWRSAIRESLTPQEASAFLVRDSYLEGVQDTFDCIVSVANSSGIMDGAVDLAISDMFCKGNIQAVIDAVQRHLYRAWNGFQPPGTCEIVDMSAFSNRHNCRYVAHTPTMRVPMNVCWDKEIVYRCFWSLMNALRLHNQTRPDKEKIRTVLCFGMATGVGRFPPDVCAAQMILAWKTFKAHQERGYSAIGWKDAYAESLDLEETHRVASMFNLGSCQ
jgi:O-acetyl-ADP-ribose deacetylase (regulator of RNase III)